MAWADSGPRPKAPSRHPLGALGRPSGSLGRGGGRGAVAAPVHGGSGTCGADITELTDALPNSRTVPESWPSPLSDFTEGWTWWEHPAPTASVAAVARRRPVSASQIVSATLIRPRWRTHFWLVWLAHFQSLGLSPL